jgi:predicted membrane-bound mannosyltransferase
MSLLRLFVTVVVAVPLFLVVGWPHPWWVTFVIAMVAISAGYGAEALFKRGKEPTASRAAEKTSTDRQWELNMLLKKAIAAEGREEWDQAIALFGQVIQKAGRPEDVDTARRHVEGIQTKRSALGGA